MKSLSLVEQEIIIMRVWDEMKFGEISQVIKESGDSIKKKYHRAIEKIKISLKSSVPRFCASSFVIPAIFTSLLTIGRRTSLAAEAKFTSTILNNLLSSSFMVTATTAATDANNRFFNFSSSRNKISIGRDWNSYTYCWWSG